MKKAKLVSFLAAVLCSISGAQASAIYNYTSNPFTDQTGDFGGQFEKLTISLTFDQPLGPLGSYGIGQQDDPLLGWYLSNAIFDLGPDLGATLLSSAIQTDASGKIASWYIIAQLIGDGGTIFQDISVFDPPQVVDGAGIYYPGLDSTASISDSPGTWSQAGQVPEPSYSALLLAALAAGFVWRRKRARG
jgi:hypothetical protein